MREVAALIEAEAQYHVARLAEGGVGFHIGRRARVGLDVRVLRAEEFLGAVYGEALGLVHELAGAVVAAAGIALGVLVREGGALRLHYGAAGVVFGGDEHDVAALALRLSPHRLRDLRVLVRQSAQQRCLLRRSARKRRSARPSALQRPRVRLCALQHRRVRASAQQRIRPFYGAISPTGFLPTQE